MAVPESVDIFISERNISAYQKEGISYMEKMNVAIIGCGSIALQRHAPEYTANPCSGIVGFYDPIPERANGMCEKFGGKAYSSIDEILADSKVDAVSVCTSNATHAGITIEALEKGKHVLCEKPMAVTLDDCIRMSEVAKRAGRVLMIGHNQRFAPAHVKAKKLLQLGELGRPITFSTTFGHRGPEYWSADKSVKTWFFKKDSAFLGASADLGIHKLDLIMWLLDDRIDTIYAHCDTLDKRDASGELIGVDDNMICCVQLKKGTIGTLTASWTYYGDEDNSTVIYCKNGILRIYDNPEFPIEVIMKNHERAYYKVGSIQTNEDKVQANSGVVDAFVDAVVHNTIPAVPVEDAVNAMRAIFACVQSSKEGRAVRL